MESETLLDRYLKTGQSADFECLVRAHGAMVFGTALRRTRSRGLAEEVTQEVFVTLARKAGTIREPEKLAAWLHRTAHFSAANVNRREAKRGKIMKAYAAERSAEEASSTESKSNQWEGVIPLLDQAIEDLSPNDRDAVIMRFYEDSSYQQIARLLGKSEAACRTQVYRALDRLSRLLRQRGAIVPPAALGVCLSHHLNGEVPPMGTEQITQLAMAAKSSTEASLASQTLLIMSGYKLSIVAASCAALIPIGLQWRSNHLEADRLSLSSNLTLPLGLDGALPGNELDSEAVRSRSSEELLAEMQEILALTNPYQIDARIDKLMMGLGEDEVPAAFAAVQQLFDASRNLKTLNAAMGLFARWAQFDPQQAIAATGEMGVPKLRQSALRGIVVGWLEHDPAAVDAFLDGLPRDGDREALVTTRWYTHAERDPLDAAEMALKIEDPDAQTRILHLVMNGFGSQDAMAGIRWLDTWEEDSVRRDNWYGRLLDDLAEYQPEEAFFETLDRLEGSLEKTTLRRVVEKWAETDPARAMEALLDLDADVSDEQIIAAFGQGLNDLSLVEAVLAKFEEGRGRSAFVAGLAASLASRRSDLRNLTSAAIEQIRPLVEALPPSDTRFSARWDLATAWAGIDAPSAVDWYASQPGVKDSMIKKISQRYTP